MPLELVPSELQPLRAQVRGINETLEDRLVCFYCGEIATCEDHVIPHSLVCRKGVDRRGWEVDTLPSCGECNVLLGAQVFDTLAERKAHLARKLRQRYGGALEHTPWTESELAELGNALRGYAIGLNATREQVTQRLAALEGRTLAPIDHTPVHTPVLPVLTLRARDIEAAPSVCPKPSAKPKHKLKAHTWTRVRYDTLVRTHANALREKLSPKDARRWVQDENGQWDFVTLR